ncbi:Pleckstrin homology domain-containing family A member 2,Pleckstrin homology domain-containing family A member 1 [Acanthosepion pharaonis]|uniref:Pleckstrin homology domain-containing family A member 2,Pleckstrin homology domain-containing family A member 1 n=1 Tax=Acanthosepion pharaonis TaxID=158019 RepID=A0A812E8C0_ACAPH|nr:Pleckstrin homology domain-containing family A member 2,Pleckstrin homology domain-containing family A member 1 [Sepia pharaonis]
MPYEDQCGRTCGFLNIEEEENTGVFKRRYFQLDSHYNKLHYFKDNPINLNRHARNPVWEIELHKVSKVSDARKLRPKVDFCFVVNFAGRRFFLQAEDQADMNKWIDVLNNASKIIVPKSEVYKQEAMEWHYGDLSQASYRTQVAGGVVCKIAQETSADELSNSTDSDENDMGRGIPACHLAAHKSGYAVKQGAVRKNWKRRFFVLTDQGISYYHSEHSLSPIRTIPKSNLLEVRVSQGIHPDRDNLFEVLTSKRIFYVQADSPTDMHSWIDAIRKLLRTVKSEERKSMQDGGNKNLNYEVELVYPKGQWGGATPERQAKGSKNATKVRKKVWLFW